MPTGKSLSFPPRFFPLRRISGVPLVRRFVREDFWCALVHPQGYGQLCQPRGIGGQFVLRIAEAVAAIDRQLSLHDTQFGEVTRKLKKSLKIMGNCGEMYANAPEHIKRAFNQAFFEKIYVLPTDDGSCEVKPLFAPPYGLLFGQEGQEEADEKKATGHEAKATHEMKTSAYLRGIAELSRLPLEWRNRRLFLGDGFNKRILVD
jgi:hypothetical protein